MWDYLDERGRETIVTDVSVTHPTPSAPTVAVPGVLAPESEPGSPRGIRDELGDVTGDEYTRYADTDAADSHPSAESFTARIDQRADTAVHLLGETDPDLGIVEAQATDAAFHLCDDERVNPSARAVGGRPVVHEGCDSGTDDDDDRTRHCSSSSRSTDGGDGPVRAPTEHRTTGGEVAEEGER